MHTDRHGRAAPGNAAHAGCATATACAARLTPLVRHTPWHACWRAAHANMRDTHPRPRLPKYTHIVAERSATARRSSHASKPKNSGGTCRNAKPPPPKKTWSVGAASAALAAQPQPLRSSGRAQHAPSPSRRTSTSRAARVAGAPRARRSRPRREATSPGEWRRGARRTSTSRGWTCPAGRSSRREASRSHPRRNSKTPLHPLNLCILVSPALSKKGGFSYCTGLQRIRTSAHLSKSVHRLIIDSC